MLHLPTHVSRTVIDGVPFILRLFPWGFPRRLTILASRRLTLPAIMTATILHSQACSQVYRGGAHLLSSMKPHPSRPSTTSQRFAVAKTSHSTFSIGVGSSTTLGADRLPTTHHAIWRELDVDEHLLLNSVVSA